MTTARQYFDFARNKSFLDVTSHQANDFQVNNAFWRHINELTAEFHEDGRFVTFPGYEWSGNTAVGGDRNVFFRSERRQIRRSSHALLADRSDIATDAPDARVVIHAVIWVERDSQKRIVIGKGGSMLKQVGRGARMEIARQLGRPVHLELWVKVRENWADSEKDLKSLGFETR